MTREWTGRHILAVLFLSFGAVAGINGYFIVEAERTYPGEDVYRPYLQGLDYNRILNGRARQAALGWRATIGGARDAKGLVTITVMLADKRGAPLPGVELSGMLRHPMDEERDRAIAFEAEGGGGYAGRIAHVDSGSWDVVVTNRSVKDAPFEAKRRIWLH